MSAPKKPQLRAIKFLNEDPNTNVETLRKKDEQNEKGVEGEEKKTEDDKSNVKGEETKIEEEVIKHKYIYKNFIVIIISALCLSISLGVNEVFLLYLRKIDTQDIILTIKYVIVLIIFTLTLSYCFNLGIE